MVGCPKDYLTDIEGFEAQILQFQVYLLHQVLRLGTSNKHQKNAKLTMSGTFDPSTIFMIGQELDSPSLQNPKVLRTWYKLICC